MGGGGALSETVLWTNPSPTSNFSAQTVTLSQDYTMFKAIRIYVKATGSATSDYYSDYPIETIQNSIADSTKPLVTINGRSSSKNPYARTLIVKTNNSFQIDTAYAIGGTSTNNGMAIPTKIAGLN